MKKFFSLLLAFMMIMSLATTAFAEEPKAEGYTTQVALHKLYTTTGQLDNGEPADPVTLYPKETLTFTATYNNDGPADAIIEGDMTVASLEANGMTGEMVITLPTFTKVGTYTYTIKENAPANVSQAVEYSQNEITVTVLVEWNENHTDLQSTVYLTQPKPEGENNSGTVGEEDKLKNDTFTNTYSVGHLTVGKTVEGNLASQDAYFEIDVTFTTEEGKYVRSDISIANNVSYQNADNEEFNPSVIEAEWTGSKTVHLKLKHDETVSFTNIPAGVKYTVIENSKHKLATGAKVNPNSAADVEYTASGEVTEAVSVAAEETAYVAINNEKSTSVATGVITDSAPYILLIAVCAAAAVLFVIKRRNTIDF